MEGCACACTSQECCGPNTDFASLCKAPGSIVTTTTILVIVSTVAAGLLCTGLQIWRWRKQRKEEAAKARASEEGRASNEPSITVYDQQGELYGANRMESRRQGAVRLKRANRRKRAKIRGKSAAWNEEGAAQRPPWQICTHPDSRHTHGKQRTTRTSFDSL